MRALTSSQQNIVDWLVAHRDSSELSFRAFLNDIFFNHTKGFSLIIQPRDEFCVFFMPVEHYENTKQRNRNIASLTDFICFLSTLNKAGLITFYTREMRPAKLYFLGDKFKNPQILKDRIQLNEDGLHSSEPSSISDRSNTPIYRGVKLTNDNYKIIFENLIGELAVSSAIEEFASRNTGRRDKIKKVFKQYGLKSLMVASILGVALLLVDLKSDYRAHHQQVLSTLSNAQTAKLMNKSLPPDKVSAGNNGTNPGGSSVVSTLSSNSNRSEIGRNAQAEKTNTPTTPNQAIPQRDGLDSARVARGIDISRWNGDVLENTAVLDQIEFVYMKATEGETHVDPMFYKNWHYLGGTSVKRGAYHFFVEDADPKTQAEHFWNTVGQSPKQEMLLVIDVERASFANDSGVDQSEFEANLLEMVEHLTAISNSKPMLYSSYWFANEYLTNPSWAELPLWIADYSSSNEPRVPATWRERGYTIWQKSDQYSVGSIDVDYDIYPNFSTTN